MRSYVALRRKYKRHVLFRVGVRKYKSLRHFKVCRLAFFAYLMTLWRYAVAQLVEALRYKSEVRGFDYLLYLWNFSLTNHSGAALWTLKEMRKDSLYKRLQRPLGQVEV